MNIPLMSQWIDDGFNPKDVFDFITPEDIVISEYKHHDAIKGVKMAVKKENI